MSGAFTLLEINDGANNSDVITSLVYEICEFFLRRGISVKVLRWLRMPHG